MTTNKHHIDVDLCDPEAALERLLSDPANDAAKERFKRAIGYVPRAASEPDEEPTDDGDRWDGLSRGGKVK